MYVSQINRRLFAKGSIWSNKDLVDSLVVVTVVILAGLGMLCLP